VVGCRLSGRTRPGVTATDIVLTITQALRRENLIGYFVEYTGPGVDALEAADRSTISNMTPETGATMGFFPVDDNELLSPLSHVNRSESDRFCFCGAGAIIISLDMMYYVCTNRIVIVNFVNNSSNGVIKKNVYDVFKDIGDYDNGVINWMNEKLDFIVSKEPSTGIAYYYRVPSTLNDINNSNNNR
jgi:hypothetical protein